MNILVVDIAAEYGGALSVLTDFYKFVKEDERSKKHNWTFIISTTALQPAQHISIVNVSKGNHPWISRLYYDNIRVRNVAKQTKPDIVLSLQNTRIWSLGKIRQAIYIHQSIPFQRDKVFSFFKRRELIYAIYQHIIGAFISYSAKKAYKVFVQTEWMKKAVSKKTKCDENKITVIPININKKTTIDLCFEHNWDNKQFFYPAFYAMYKNQKLILDAAKILESRDVNSISITLTTGSEFDCRLIKDVGQIPHNEVVRRLRESTLIFPSYIETVGLPLIEAMEVGTVILAANCDYAHETVGKYENAYFFNPFNPVELADLIEDVYNGKIVRKKSFVSQVSEDNSWIKVLDELLLDN